MAYTGQPGLLQFAADRVLHLPDAITAETAAASLLKGMTAEFLLRRCYPLKAGEDETILVHTCGRGVGGILTQWAKAIGATVIGAVGSDDKADIARANDDHVALSP